MNPTSEDRRIRQLRPPKRRLDPWKPIGTRVEEERDAEGKLSTCLTVFLTGRECPFTCVFCDLWQYTLDVATPVGAIPSQIADALGDFGELPVDATIKLYNASNFFDDKAVPRQDWRKIAELLKPFARVIVESHPLLVTDNSLEFGALLEGRLEVALGLETIHPGALPRLNKRLTLDDFERAASLLRSHGVGIRSFVLVGAPFIPESEALDWVVRSAGYAQRHGSGVVSLIPLRGGNGEMERLAQAGDFQPPTVALLEASLERAQQADQGVVLADLWDADELPGCDACRASRLERIARLNRAGSSQPSVSCTACQEPGSPSGSQASG